MDGENLRHLWDYYSLPADNLSMDWQDIKEVTFLGYGIDDPAYNDYKSVDVRDKAIMIYQNEPQKKDGNYLISGNTSPSDWSGNIDKKLQIAKKHGVKVVFIIDDDFKKNVSQARKEILSRRLAMVEEIPEDRNLANSIFLSSEVAKKMIGKQFKKVVKTRKRIQKKGKSKPVSIAVDLRVRQEKAVRSLVGENVLGYIEGSDPELKNELLVITAHYDHLGKRGDDIYFGADDNGSGTSTVLEVAPGICRS